MCIAFLIALPAAALAAKPANSDVTAQVVERLDMDYAREIIEEVCAMGDSEIGFRGAGGSADQEAAAYMADQMEVIGLVDVVLEAVPVSTWEFRGAYLEVPGMEQMVAASFGGFPGTDDQSTPDVHESLVGEVVWVNNGYDADYSGKDVEGKIVLVNWIGYDYWVDSIAYGAWEHGAKGIIVTTIDSNVGQNDWALSCHDGLYVTGWPPMISISPENATKIIEALGSGESLTVTMYSDILKLPELAGTGYNPVGYLPGKYYGTAKDEFVIFGPHHDAWFQGAMDDTSGMAALLVVAKAMREVMDETGWVPDRTVIFTSHTAEEYGLDNTYYDWCWGAYYQINVEHADDWIGRTVGYLCMELMGMAGEPIYINCVPELYTYTRDVLAANIENMPYGFNVDNNAHTWADHWTFSAAGVPGLEFETTSEEWEEYYYHTQCDAPEIIDYSYLEQCFAVISDLTVGMVTSTFAPYDFETLATDLSSHLLHEEELWGVSALDEIYAYFGMSTENRDRLLSEAARFQEDSAALKAALATVNPAKAHEVNTELMSIVGTLDTALIAIGVWEQDWYPYQQPINDVYHLWWALEKLWAKMDGTGDDMGLGTLNWVGMTWYYAYSSYDNYMDQRDRLTGDRVASWGLQTHLQPAVDIWWEYDALMSVKGPDGPTFEDVLWVVPSLEEVLGGTALAQLEDAFVLMWTALEDANGQVEDLVEDISKGS